MLSRLLPRTGSSPCRFLTIRACATAAPGAGSSDADVVTPWAVKATGPKGIDYGRVVNTFQSTLVDDVVTARFAAVAKTGAAGSDLALRFLRRRIAFSHRDLANVLDDVAAGRTCYLYTGRGPSKSTMHVGHMVPFLLAQALQEALQLPIVIQLTDDEKYLFRDTPLNAMDKMTDENIKDIIAFGFDPARTFIFRNTRYFGHMYPTVLQIQRQFTANAVKNTFGFSMSDSVGKFAFAATQAAPAFISSFPQVLPLASRKVRCLIPCAIDQDPFFILTRGASDALKGLKPALLHTKFLPALRGATAKMSSSAEGDGVILLSDDAKTVRKKMASAFSGGRGTLQELQEKGADLDADVAYTYLSFFLEDDAELASIGAAYRTGQMTSAAVKDRAAVCISDQLERFRARRAAVTDADVDHFGSIRSILPPRPPRQTPPA